MSLAKYRSKRDFKKTTEPAGKVAPADGERRFVVQKHDASRLHYDFRLELEGILKSWAVPKGPPFKKGDKRLAVMVEDHPLDYADFEGIIPQGEYGGGTVMVWDTGMWTPLGGDPERDLKKGKLHFAVEGAKLRGEWTLVRIRGEETQWLLLKSGTDMRAVTKKRDDESAITGRTMSQIAQARDAEGSSQPRRFVAPMMAKLANAPPRSGDWIYELKFDGYRALALKDGESVRLLSRNEKDFTKKFAEIAEAVAGLKCEGAIIDGEVVALDEEGRPSFQLLQQYELAEEQPPLCYYVFDLLEIDGEDLRELPIDERKKRLEKLGAKAGEPIRFSSNLEGDPERVLEEVRKRGLEGLIGKRRDSRYESARRSGAWIKLKCLSEQEFVIGGYTPPQGSRKWFGALLVGYHETGKLHFAAKVGTGFSAKLLKALHAQFQPLRQEVCPFSNLPTKRHGRWGQGITKAEMAACTWLEPSLVCQVRFTEWTGDGGLRHPAFLGLRDDKAAAQVVRETAR